MHTVLDRIAHLSNTLQYGALRSFTFPLTLGNITALRRIFGPKMDERSGV